MPNSQFTKKHKGLESKGLASIVSSNVEKKLLKERERETDIIIKVCNYGSETWFNSLYLELPRPSIWSESLIKIMLPPDSGGFKTRKLQQGRPPK